MSGGTVNLETGEDWTNFKLSNNNTKFMIINESSLYISDFFFLWLAKLLM